MCMKGAMGSLRHQVSVKTNRVRDRFTIQIVFNICLTLLLCLISLGFWKCSSDINRLTKSTELLEETLLELTTQLRTGETERVDSVKLVYETVSNEDKHGQDVFDVRNLFKRSLPSYKTFDPLSSNPQVRYWFTSGVN